MIQKRMMSTFHALQAVPDPCVEKLILNGNEQAGEQESGYAGEEEVTS